MGSGVRRQDAGRGEKSIIAARFLNCGNFKKRACALKARKPLFYMWCPEPGSNRHVQRTRDFKSLASTNFAIGAVAPSAGNIYISPSLSKLAHASKGTGCNAGVEKNPSINQGATKSCPRTGCQGGEGSSRPGATGHQLAVRDWRIFRHFCLFTDVDPISAS